MTRLGTWAFALLLGGLAGACIDVRVGSGTGDSGRAEGVGVIDGAARAQDTLGAVCNRDQDCWPASVCLQGICGRECVTHFECGKPGLRCLDWRCIDGADVAPPADTGGDAGALPDPGPSDPGGHDPGKIDPGQPDPGPTDPGPPDSGCGGPAGQPYGAVCACPGACTSGLCLSAGGASGFCTQDCGTAKDCPGDHVCYDLGGDDRICAPSDAGKPVDCTSFICLSGLNLQNGQGQCLCTVDCVDGADCPPDHACSFAATPAGNRKVCVKVGGACVPSPQNPGACYQLCYPESGGQGFCTATCESTTDCPAGSPCKSEILPDGTLLKTCQ